jgi:hypothetical protein
MNLKHSRQTEDKNYAFQENNDKIEEKMGFYLLKKEAKTGWLFNMNEVLVLK